MTKINLLLSHFHSTRFFLKIILIFLYDLEKENMFILYLINWNRYLLFDMVMIIINAQQRLQNKRKRKENILLNK